MSNNDNNPQANPAYYSQDDAEVLAGGNRMAEALQETAGTTPDSQPLSEAMASGYDPSVRGTSQSARTLTDAPSQTEANKEGTYEGFSTGDTTPGNIEGWAGPEFAQDDTDADRNG